MTSRRCLTVLDQDSTLIAVIEMSLSSWLVAGIVPGIERQPLKKLEADKHALLKLLHRWRDEAMKAGRKITRIAVAFEAGRDGFWLARWLRAHDIEAHVIHASSVAVTEKVKKEEVVQRSQLRGERDHCKVAAIPTLAEEDAKRPNRERESLVGECSRLVNRMKAAFVRLGIRGFNPKLKKAPERLGALRTPEGEPIPPNTVAAAWLIHGRGGRMLAARSNKRMGDELGRVSSILRVFARFPPGGTLKCIEMVACTTVNLL